MHPQTLSFSKQIHPVDPTPPPGPPPNLCLLAEVFYSTAVAALSIEWSKEIRRRNGKGLEGALDGLLLKEHKIVQIPIDFLSFLIKILL